MPDLRVHVNGTPLSRAQLTGIAQAVAEDCARQGAALREQMTGEVASLLEAARSAREAAAAATQRAEALTVQVAGYDRSLEVLRTSLAPAISDAVAPVHSLQVAGLSIDGNRLTVRRNDSTELVAEIPRPDLEAVALLVVERHLAKLRGDPGDKGDKGDKGDPGNDGNDGKTPTLDLTELAAVVRSDAAFVAMSRGDKGDAGDKGDRGDEGPVGVPDVAEVAAVMRADADFVDMVRGAKGDKGDAGDRGDKGDEGPAGICDLVELAEIVRSEPGFVEMVKGDKGDAGESIKGDAGDKGDRGEPGPPGEPSEPWAPGVHRAGVRRSHFMGRVYEATADTTDEPGDSPHWRRLDTTGLRHIGGNDPREPGDLHAKEGATFLYDGARNWMLAPKAFTQGDAERTLKPVRQQLRGQAEAMAALDTRYATIADLARGARADANEALQWIARRAEAIDELLGGGR